jgi:hypothetical protein
MGLSKEENDRLTQVEPGTPMGELFRRYWLPVAASADLREDPVKQVRILGETLVLYRDRRGRLGLIGKRCSHRGTALVYGIPEAEGLRPGMFVAVELVTERREVRIIGPRGPHGRHAQHHRVIERVAG